MEALWLSVVMVMDAANLALLDYAAQPMVFLCDLTRRKGQTDSP